MTKVAVEQVFNGTYSVTTLPSYNPDNINVGSLLNQWNLGSGPNDKFVGPAPVLILRPNEATTAIPPAGVQVVQFSPTQWWLFYADNATAAATRRIGLYFYNPVTHQATWQGFITLTYPQTGNATIRGFRMTRDLYTTGTVAVSGTGVTGTGTTWTADRLAVGSRIGFGSTDPTAITTWYQISAIGSDTSITLTASAGTISAGTPYVIEDLRCVTVTTNATAANGGLAVAKGLRIEAFISAGTTIPAATTVDNIRAVYWLRTAASETYTTACGLGLEARTSWTAQNIFLVNGGGGTTLNIARMNVRAALTLTAGGATLTGGDLTTTGNQTVTGNLQQNNSVRLGTLAHSPVSGTSSLFITTATRVLRVATANVTAGNTTFLSDQMLEVPPGGTNSFPASGALSSVEVADSIDRLVVTTGAFASDYVTRYRTDSGQMDHKIFSDTRQQDQGTADSTIAANPRVNKINTATLIWSEAGMFFMTRIGTTSALSTIHVFPGGAHWTYTATTNQRVICPRITLGATPAKFYRVMVNAVETLGSDEFGHAPEPFRILYRTAGITDNSGSWTVVPANGDISGVSAATSIQFAFEFKTLGEVCTPARILSLALIYEDVNALPSQYQWNFADSSTTDGTFGFIQRTTFGASLTTHTINIYRADTNALVLTQASTGVTNGNFQFWDGSAWTNGLGTDAVGTRRRFVPSSGLPSGVDLYAEILVA